MYQTFEAVFHGLFMHLDCCQKFSDLIVYSTLFSMSTYPDKTVPLVFVILLGACLLGVRITLSIGLTLAGEQKIARVYKQNFTGKVTLQPGTTLCAVTLKGSVNH